MIEVDEIHEVLNRAEFDLFGNAIEHDQEWIAEFDPDRQIVISKLGPYKRLFVKPPRFVKRFYQEVYPITIQRWLVDQEHSLFKGFCHLSLSVDVSFQVTLEYVERNIERISHINEHVQQLYFDQINDVIQREIAKLDDGLWVKEGLDKTQTKIAISICELLTIHKIQAQAQCSLKAVFEEFPEVKPGKDNVFLNVLKKSYEIAEANKAEQLRQLIEQEQLVISEKARELDQLKQLADMDLLAQSIQADKERKLLEDKKSQLKVQLAIQKEIYAERVQHQSELKTLEFENQLRESEQNQAKQRLSELKMLTAQLAHESEMEELRLQSNIERRARTHTLGIETDIHTYDSQ